MIRTMIALLIVTLALAAPARADDDLNYFAQGDYLYKVTTVRAAPGKLEALLKWYKDMEAAGFYRKAGERRAPFLMRHSQGDQWDLMVISPMEGWFSYYNKRRNDMFLAAEEEMKDLYYKGKNFIDFSEDHFAYGPDITILEKAYGENALFHIEMFNAAAGKSGDLYRQREMENEYLHATGQRPNMIFWVEAGGDVDVFTIGFHPSLEAFAAPGPASDEDKEAAATAAGFKDRADISFYLRSLIRSHHDTLATKVE